MALVSSQLICSEFASAAEKLDWPEKTPRLADKLQFREAFRKLLVLQQPYVKYMKLTK